MKKKKTKPLYYVFFVSGIIGAILVRRFVLIEDPQFGDFFNSPLGAGVAAALGFTAGHFAYKFMYGNPIEEIDTEPQNNDENNKPKN